MAKQTGFGQYVRRCRVAARLSLRDVADRLAIGHVYLGEVERGVRGPFDRKHWPALTQAIPGVDIEELERLAELDKPMQFNLSQAPPQYQNLALALARRIRERNLSDRDVKRLLRVLGDDDDE
jgi:transcriptional regulator with XRE-family HTH domain